MAIRRSATTLIAFTLASFLVLAAVPRVSAHIAAVVACGPHPGLASMLQLINL
jgi:hypothetical protein